MEHHRGGKDSGMFVSRHPYKKRFEQAYSSEIDLLEEVNKLIKGMQETK